MSLNFQTNSNEGPTAITVDVIVPMHNSEHTIIPAIESVYDQINPYHTKFQLDVAICVYDDCSTDNSFQVLNEFKLRRSSQKTTRSIGIDICLLFDRNIQQSMGAGFARNRAAELREKFSKECKGKGGEYLCLLDSDDLMRPTRIAEQISCFYDMDSGNRLTTLMGCQFERIPVDSTWHYTAWANGLSDERLVLEQYRELTLIQPTWMLTRERFMLLGGYVEAPLKDVAYRKLPSTSFDEKSLTYEFSKPKIKSKRSAELESIVNDSSEQGIENIREIATKHRLCDYSLIRVDESPRSLRIAEDLRLFHAHMIKNGRLHLCRSKTPLMIYRHREGMSQSSNTPRQLLLKLRAKAIEDRLLHTSVFRDGFAIWGAGRDGKAFLRALSTTFQSKVRCFADVDEKKIRNKFYFNRDLSLKIPIIHFSDLSSSLCCHDNERQEIISRKRMRMTSEFGKLPVIVCVAMYRTNGDLEANVKSIGRVEGVNLWHLI